MEIWKRKNVTGPLNYTYSCCTDIDIFSSTPHLDRVAELAKVIVRALGGSLYCGL